MSRLSIVSLRTLITMICVGLVSLALISCDDADNEISGPGGDSGFIESISLEDGGGAFDTRLAVVVHFVDSVRVASVNRSTFTLNGGLIPCSVTCDGLSARLHPEVALAADSVYTVSLSRHVCDYEWNYQEEDYLWSFRLELESDSVPPEPVRLGPLVRIGPPCETSSVYTEASIYLDSTVLPAWPIGGFDLLVQFDPTVAELIRVEPGAMLTSCGWEYFTYLSGSFGRCGGDPCPEGTVRIVAIAETNNGSAHPNCYTYGSESTSGELARLQIAVTSSDLNFDMLPIRFVWYDCGDNTLSSVSADQVYMSRMIHGYSDTLARTDIAADEPFPTWLGANSECDGESRVGPRIVDFASGGVEVPGSAISYIGDLNVNEVPYEIADAVLYSNYFVFGLSAFTLNIELQIAASDVNQDGYVLTPADLVFLISVIRGDAVPVPHLGKPFEEMVEVSLQNGYVNVRPTADIGALQVVLSGEVDPELLVQGMDMRYEFDGTNTRVLLYSMDGATIVVSGGGALPVLGVHGATSLVAIDASDADGAMMMTVLGEGSRE